MTIVAVSFLLIAVASTTFYSSFSGYLGSKVKSPWFQNTFNKANGTMLMGAGEVTASAQK